MGVPAFFRWLSMKYPSIITDAVEEKKLDPEGNALPVDTSTKNPNTEYDNLYLDMNGIIHPCTHPEGQPPPKDEEEMMKNVYDVIDRLFLIARPRKVLYLAVDGVAPRAKMNQQRSRRFRAAQEAQEKKMEEKKVREEAIAAGHQVPPEKESNGFDSNCITPGTEFMHKVAHTLAKYAVERLASDPGFRDVKVIVSDASIPGEGEHKIMQFIRQQRAQPGYDPNTKHCISGLDADLIMLGLATHEPHFSVLREVVTFDRKTCRTCGREGHYQADCPVTRGEALPEEEGPRPPTPYQFLHLYVLREYLDQEFRPLEAVLPFPYDLEKIVDDFVFMCFFVGNDFLPHMPTLEIREGAIELLMSLYKKILPSLDGYLTNNGEVYQERTKVLVKELSILETGILQKRRDREQREARNRREQEERRKAGGGRGGFNDRGRGRGGYNDRGGGRGGFNDRGGRGGYNDRGNDRGGYTDRGNDRGGNENGGYDRDANKNAAQAFKKRSRDGEEEPFIPNKRLDSAGPDTPRTPNTSSDAIAPSPTTPNTPQTPSTPNTPNTPNTPKPAEEPEDAVRLGEDGYRDRYYTHKFKSDLNDIDAIRAICGSYIEGLAWVLRYYYQGCCSWKWFYPYHFAPFATDIAEWLGNIQPTFNLGTPFKPFEQLMGVLPPASCKCVPKPYRYIMGVTEEGEVYKESPILGLYPTDFKLDMNGKRLAWQAVVLLPFIEEKEFLEALDGIETQLTVAERHRNSLGEDLLFVNTHHPLSQELVMAQELKAGEIIELSFDKGGLTGTIKKYGVLQLHNFGDVIELFQNVVGAVFTNPPFPKGFIHESKLLEGLVPPVKVLEGGDYRGGAGGLGAADGGYHRMQNSAAIRHINHNLGYRTDKPRGGIGSNDGNGGGFSGPNNNNFGGGRGGYGGDIGGYGGRGGGRGGYGLGTGPKFIRPNDGGIPNAPQGNNSFQPQFPIANYNQNQQQQYNNYNQNQQQQYNNNYNQNQQQQYNNNYNQNQNQQYNNNYNQQQQGYNNNGNYNQQQQYNSNYNQQQQQGYNNNGSRYQQSPYPSSFPSNYNPFAGRGGRR